MNIYTVKYMWGGGDRVMDVQAETEDAATAKAMDLKLSVLSVTNKDCAKHKFKVGDKVVYINQYGVCFGIKTITGLDRTYNSHCDYAHLNGRPVYLYEGIDTPWCPVHEDRFQLANEEAIAHEGDAEWFAKNYGWVTPEHLLDELLDGDPWEGEK